MGITGGIGSGKSYVCKILQRQFGIPVYDCDSRAKVLTATNADIIRQLKQLIPDVYDEEEGLNKAKMARYLFASRDNTLQVNAIIHPVVRDDLRHWFMLHQDFPVAAMESAILYESGFHKEVDRVLFVDAPLSLRIERTMKRDKTTREQVEQRIVAQAADLARQQADYRIINDGTTDLVAELTQILNQNH